MTMSRRTKARSTRKAKKFSFQKQSYVLPVMNAIQLLKAQPADLMLELKACNSSLPPKASFELLSAAFHTLLSRLRRFLTDVESRQAKYHWRESFRAYKAGFKKRGSSTPKMQQNTQTPDKGNKSITIDHQDYWISKQYKNLRTQGIQSFARNFISMNPDHQQQDFTPRVLKQALNAYVTGCPDVSLEIKQGVMQRTTSKRAQRFLKECGKLAAAARTRAAAAKPRAEVKAAAHCSADSSDSDSETEPDATETQDATDSSNGEDEDGMQDAVPAAISSSASTSTESEAEYRTVQSCSEDDGDSPSITTSSESELATQEVMNESHEPVLERSNDDSNYDKMNIDNYHELDNARAPKRRRESTSPPSLHHPIRSQDTHPPRAKRLRMAKSSSPRRNSPSSTEEYGPGRDIFSTLMDYLDQFR